jgi:hypothetical protein
VVARTTGGTLDVSVQLRGGFVEAVDQNLYLFVGRAPDASPGASWSLSDDPAFFEGLGYPIRAAVSLPGEPLRRIAILSPRIEAYSPQVYERSRGEASETGPGTPVTLASTGSVFEVTVDLPRLLGSSAAGDDPLWLTVATARDYVGFVSDVSLPAVRRDGDEVSATPTSPAMHYPSLEPSSHQLVEASIARSGSSLDVAVRTLSPIRDWAQTNVTFYFFSLPAPRLAHPPRDASKSFDLPAGWSFYCAVYSPTRVFCRRADPTTWAYDDSYSERRQLEMPQGIRVDATGSDVRLSLDDATTGLAGRDVAVMVMVGRDGFAPSFAYGARPLQGSSVALCAP